METNSTFETDIAKLPRSKRARHAQPDDCFCCGKPIEIAQWEVVTGQGGYPVGPECKTKCVKLGFEVGAVS